MIRLLKTTRISRTKHWVWYYQLEWLNVPGRTTNWLNWNGSFDSVKNSMFVCLGYEILLKPIEKTWHHLRVSTGCRCRCYGSLPRERTLRGVHRHAPCRCSQRSKRWKCFICKNQRKKCIFPMHFSKERILRCTCLHALDLFDWHAFGPGSRGLDFVSISPFNLSCDSTILTGILFRNGWVRMTKASTVKTTLRLSISMDLNSSIRLVKTSRISGAVRWGAIWHLSGARIFTEWKAFNATRICFNILQLQLIAEVGIAWHRRQSLVDWDDGDGDHEVVWRHPVAHVSLAVAEVLVKRSQVPQCHSWHVVTSLSHQKEKLLNHRKSKRWTRCPTCELGGKDE